MERVIRQGAIYHLNCSQWCSSWRLKISTRNTVGLISKFANDSVLIAENYVVAQNMYDPWDKLSNDEIRMKTRVDQEI